VYAFNSILVTISGMRNAYSLVYNKIIWNLKMGVEK